MSLRKLSGLLLFAVAGTPGIADAQQALENLEKQLAQQPAELSAPVEEPGYLGIIADDRDTQGRGIRLLDVLATGPAAKAGLQTGDTITSIDGVQVKSLDDMAKIMVGRVVGEEVSFVATRGIEAVRVDVVLTKRPPPEERRFGNFGRINEQGTDIVSPNDAPSALPPSALPPGINSDMPLGSRVVAAPTPSVSGRTIPHPAPPSVPKVDTLPPPEAIASIPQTERPTIAPPLGATLGSTNQAPTMITALPPRGTTVNPTMPLPINPNSLAASALRTGLLGIRTTRITPELQLAMNLPEPRGALVIEVRPDSPAKLAGIPIDAVIVAADARRLDGPDDLAALVAERGPGAEVRLSYYRYGQLYEKTVKLVAPPPVVVAEVPPSSGNVLRGGGKNLEAPGPGPGRMEPSVGLPPSTVPPAAVPPSTQPPISTPLPVVPQFGAGAVGSTGPTLAPSLPSIATKVATAAPTPEEAEQIRRQIRDLEAQLKALEKRLPPEQK